VRSFCIERIVASQLLEALHFGWTSKRLTTTETTIMTVVVTACPQKKRAAHNSLLSARNLSRGLFPVSLRHGLTASSGRKPNARLLISIPVAPFLEAIKEAQASQAELYVVSAGLGFVHGSDLVPSYDLTVSKGSDSCIMDKLEVPGSESRWWAALGGGKARQGADDGRTGSASRSMTR
jgi:hypothetical protein